MAARPAVVARPAGQAGTVGAAWPGRPEPGQAAPMPMIGHHVEQGRASFHHPPHPVVRRHRHQAAPPGQLVEERPDGSGRQGDVGVEEDEHLVVGHLGGGDALVEGPALPRPTVGRGAAGHHAAPAPTGGRAPAREAVASVEPSSTTTTRRGARRCAASESSRRGRVASSSRAGTTTTGPSPRTAPLGGVGSDPPMGGVAPAPTPAPSPPPSGPGGGVATAGPSRRASPRRPTRPGG